MTHFSAISNPLPVAPALLQQGPHFDVERCTHGRSIAKLCASDKQPIAMHGWQSLAMGKKTLNQLLGENLQALMTQRGLSANVLGPKAGLAPNTVGNYLKADPASVGSVINPKTGKERSAKLAEVEMLAAALGVHPLALLTDPESLQAMAKQMAEAAVSSLGRAPAAVPSTYSTDDFNIGHSRGTPLPSTKGRKTK